MTYSSEIIRSARVQLDEARLAHEHLKAQRLEAAYSLCPRLREIDIELRKTVTSLMVAAFQAGEDGKAAMERVKLDNLGLQKERALLMRAHGLSEADLAQDAYCPHCQGGLGYVGERLCVCLQAFCREAQNKAFSNMSMLGTESFETFSLSHYSSVYNEKFHASEQQLMRGIAEACKRYAEEFSLGSPSLLFQGGPGLGKTFLSTAIARAVSEKGFSVCYVTASKLVEDFESEKFSAATGLTQKYLQCDLMILDDLATEMQTQFTQAALYTLIDRRINARLPSVVSTNLTPSEMRTRYSAQIASRLLGHYELLHFVGQDIRMRR